MTLAGTFTFSNAVNPKVSFDIISVNEYVACYYDSNWWARLVQNVNCDEKNVEINVLHSPGLSNSFTWPKRKGVCWETYMNVIWEVRSQTTSTG